MPRDARGKDDFFCGLEGKVLGVLIASEPNSAEFWSKTKLGKKSRNGGPIKGPFIPLGTIVWRDVRGVSQGVSSIGQT